jgi:hypothetical protein
MKCPRCAEDLAYVGASVYLCYNCESVFKISEVENNVTYEILKDILEYQGYKEVEL